MHPYLNKNINVQMVSFVIPLYMNNQKEIDGYNRNARADTQVSIARGIAKAVEKVKHQEKYERHVKWELAMEIELYFT